MKRRQMNKNITMTKDKGQANTLSFVIIIYTESSIADTMKSFTTFAFYVPVDVSFV